MTVARKVFCPSCKVGLRIGATIAAGKRIRCPKCTHAFTLPQHGDSPPAPKASGTRPRPSVRVPEGPQDNERPLQRKRLKKRKGPDRKRPLVLGLVIAGAVLLLGTGVTLAVVRPWQARKSAVPNNSLVAASPPQGPAAESRPESGTNGAPQVSPRALPGHEGGDNSVTPAPADK